MAGIFAGLIGSLKRVLSWSTGTVTDQVYRDATYSNLTNGKYFAFGPDSQGSVTTSYQYSTDGSTFITGTLPASNLWTATASSPTRVIALRSSSTTGYYTDNGTTWVETGAIAASSQSPRQIIWDGTRFIVAAGSSRALYYSTNGTGSWSSITSLGITTGSALGVGYDGINRHIITSTSTTAEAGTTTSFPSSWSLITMPSTGVWVCPVYGNGIWVATRLGSSSYGTSTNGTTWTSRTLPSLFSETTSDLYAKLIFTDGKFYYYQTNNLYSSTDGINWVTEATVTGGSLDNVNGWAVGGGKIIAFGYDKADTGSPTILKGS